MELVALVKHDCPVCDQLLPALDEARAGGAPIRILSQSGPGETAAQAHRLKLESVPELDAELELSARFEPTSRDPQDLVALVPPYDGEATIEKVAINAVMAGCPQNVFPIVLAAVEAACDPEFALLGLVSTTHPSGPVIVVSGPLADKA